MTNSTKENIDAERMLTMDEVAQRLGVHLNTVRNWIRRGDLNVVKWGPRFVRIREADLATFMRGGSNG